MQTHDTTPVLTTTEVASLLNVAHKTLANWRCHGSGPTFLKLGSSVRYLKDDIDNWLSQHRYQSTAQFELRK